MFDWALSDSGKFTYPKLYYFFNNINVYYDFVIYKHIRMHLTPELFMITLEPVPVRLIMFTEHLEAFTKRFGAVVVLLLGAFHQEGEFVTRFYQVGSLDVRFRAAGVVRGNKWLFGDALDESNDRLQWDRLHETNAALSLTSRFNFLEVLYIIEKLRTTHATHAVTVPKDFYLLVIDRIKRYLQDCKDRGFVHFQIGLRHVRNARAGVIGLYNPDLMTREYIKELLCNEPILYLHRVWACDAAREILCRDMELLLSSIPCCVSDLDLDSPYEYDTNNLEHCRRCIVAIMNECPGLKELMAKDCAETSPEDHLRFDVLGRAIRLVESGEHGPSVVPFELD